MQAYLEELGRLARLALPLVLTQLAQMGMSVADTVMAGRVNAVELAGVALATVVFWPVMLLVSGTIMAITPSVSQLHGAGRPHEAGEVVRQAQWIALAGGLVLFGLFRNLGPLYTFVGVDPLALPVTEAYLEAISWGVIPVLFFFSMRYLCEGLGWTLPAMIIAGSALLLKVPLNFWFIYGGFGVPALGGEGCGWASVIVFCYQLLAMTLIVRFSRINGAGLFARFSPPRWSAIWKLIMLGAPIGLSTFFEFSVFSTMTLLIGRLGVETVAAHQIAANVGGLTFMVPLALGMAASIRVGYNVGAGDLYRARRSGWVALAASLGFALVAATVLVLANEAIARLYSNEAAVVALAGELLILVALYQPVDDLQATAIGALRGYKDTRTPFFVAVGAYWLVAFPVSWALGFGYFESINLGVHGYWIGLIVGLGVAAAALLARFVYLAKRHDRIALLAAR